jgi:hypothetical protein
MDLRPIVVLSHVRYYCSHEILELEASACFPTFDGLLNRNSFEAAMKTVGEIEAAVCAGITRSEQDYMGRGPKEIRTHLRESEINPILTGLRRLPDIRLKCTQT